MPESPFVAQIGCFPFNVVPRNWARCDGQLLVKDQNAALFELLEYKYGGGGPVFALPNLQGRFPMGQGPGLGLSDRAVGDSAGEDEVTLLLSEIPQHTHAVRASGTAQTTNRPAGAVPAIDGAYGAPDSAVLDP